MQTMKQAVLTHAQLLGQLFDGGRGVGAHGEESDERLAAVTLVPHPLQVQDHTLGVLLA